MSIYRKFLTIVGICVGFSFSCSAKENALPFIPTVYWSEQSEKGVILSAPNEMTPVDSKGTKYPKIISSEPVEKASISPDGGKIIYVTATALWITAIDSQVSAKVYSGICDVPRWNKDGSGFTFAAFEKKDVADVKLYIKLLWADSDGKNLKQVYP